MQKDISPFKNCEWLTFPDVEANITRSAFDASNVREATLEMTALGYYEVYVNGNTLTDDKYIPAMSDYERRDLSKINMPVFDEQNHRIYYAEYNITEHLHDGKNILAVRIGAGWYGQCKSPNEGMTKWGDNLLVFRITLIHADGKKAYIYSNQCNTKWTKSFIKESSLYYGEYQDGNLYKKDWNAPAFDDSDWNIPNVRPMPDSELCLTDFPTDKVLRTITPKIVKIFGDIKIYDLGETASGYAVVVFDEGVGKNEEAVTRYADELNEDGSLQFHYCGGTNRIQGDRFIHGRNVIEFYPHFTWHAARYIELRGNARITEYRVVGSDIKKISDFSSDNETLDWIFNAFVRTQLANIHGCIPSDCPHRERLGYTGDGQLTCGAVMSVFNAREMYRKWATDIRDGQDKKGGHVQHTAPFYGGGGGPGGWGGAACIVPYRYYKFYDDVQMLKASYDSMKAYIGYMLRHSEDGIVTSAEPGGWCLGDWCPLHNKITIPAPFVNTYFLKKCADITAETASILGKSEDEKFFREISESTAAAIKREFFDPTTGSFCEGNQGADAFAVDIGIEDSRTLENLVKKYEKIGTFDTGIFGTYLLIKVFFEKKYGSLAFRLLTNEGEASFSNMKRHGATTLWENWDGCDSRCHPMFGAIVEFFFSEILGIKRYKDEPGYKKIYVSPADIPELKEVHGVFGTQYGHITVDILTDKDGNKQIDVKTPFGITLI